MDRNTEQEWQFAASGLDAARAWLAAQPTNPSDRRLALFTTLLILSVLMVLKPIEKRFFKRPSEALVSVVVPRGETEIERVRAVLGAIGAFPMSIRIHELNDTDDRLEIDVGLPAHRTTSDLLRQLRTMEGAKQILITRDLIEDRVRAGN